MIARSKKIDLYGKFDPVLDAVLKSVQPDKKTGKLREIAEQPSSRAAEQPSSRAAEQSSPKLKTFIDLFCGIGGFHVAASNLGMECLFACDIDEEARKAYQQNFGLHPHGDIISTPSKNIPDHDLLCAGFPCQPFSISGSRKGFSDPRGTLFFEVARIIRDKQPKAVVLENVRQLASINH